MPSTPLRVLIPELFAADLAAELTIPHEIRVLKSQTDTEVADLLEHIDVLVSGAYKAAWQPQGASALRLVQSVGAGVDGIDTSALPKGCRVCNVYGHERGVAEQAFMLMLSLQKGLLSLDEALRRGNWTPQRAYLSELRERRLLILGLGHIGKELVRWGRFLDMPTTVLTRHADPERAAGLDLAHFGSLSELEHCLPVADFVVVAIPAGDGSLGLIGEKEVSLMKSGAFVINVGRGAVIDEAALYRALRGRSIAGAGLDVWWQYPSAPGQECQPSKYPFGELDNVVMTPHKPTLETMTYRWREIAANLARLVADEPLSCVVH